MPDFCFFRITPTSRFLATQQDEQCNWAAFAGLCEDDLRDDE
jgi:hypothetical protein